jgi:hypothetical protein
MYNELWLDDPRLVNFWVNNQLPQNSLGPPRPVVKLDQSYRQIGSSDPHKETILATLDWSDHAVVRLLPPLPDSEEKRKTWSQA